MKNNSLLIVLFFSLSFIIKGQTNDYNYKRPIFNIKQGWNSVYVSPEMYKNLNHSLTDIRILGLTNKKDSVEIPYILAPEKSSIYTHKVKQTVINTTKNKQGYFFTFQLPEKKNINEILLHFEQKNFDWNVTIEGSHNQNEWFTIAEKQRVLSINNKDVSFSYAKLSFKDSNFLYYRIFIPFISPQPILLNAEVNYSSEKKFPKIQYAIKSLKKLENKKTHTSEYTIELNSVLPIDELMIYVKKELDFYRPVLIEYATDSIKTKNKWIPLYIPLQDFLLSSIKNNSINLQDIRTKRLRIIIQNNNNFPLTIDSIYIAGHRDKLIFYTAKLFDSYLLLYGQENNAPIPSYDISYFKNKIPEETNLALLQKETIIKKPQHTINFNKVWLWIIMAIIILLLGGFSIKMMQKT